MNYKNEDLISNLELLIKAAKDMQGFQKEEKHIEYFNGQISAFSQILRNVKAMDKRKN